VAVERKGGVQLTTVSFTTDEHKAGGKGAPRGGLRKRELRPKRQQQQHGKRPEEEEKSQEVASQEAVKNEE
jgi:hypothetical protein